MIGKILHWFSYGDEITLPQRPEREKYIPVHVLDLIDVLCVQVAARGQDDGAFRDFCRSILSLIHQDYRRRHQQLTRLYTGLDPDIDRLESPSTLRDRIVSSPSKQGEPLPYSASGAPLSAPSATTHFFHDLGDVLERANYRRLSPRQIQAAVASSSYWGGKLRVRFSMFRRLEVYARGEIDATRVHRHWSRLWRKEEISVPMYQRLVVVYRVKEGRLFDEKIDPRKVHLRMFKNIPKFDVDMLLPGTGVRISWIDRGKIGIPSAWGFAMMFWRIIRNAWLLALIGIAKAFTSIFVAVAVTVALIYVLVKSFFSYTSTKRRYLLDVTKNLYYQNLDNNMGGLLRLLDDAEQQEACESIMAYFVLTAPNRTVPMTTEELDRQCEAELEQLTGFAVDFDVDDAIRDLLPLRILESDENGWVALPIHAALARLNEKWDQALMYHPEPEEKRWTRS